MAIEIKAATKADSNMTSGLKYWQKLNRNSQGLLIYGGKTAVDFSDQLQAISWNEISSVF